MRPLFRTLAIGLVPIALTACMSQGPATADQGAMAPVPLGVDLGSSAASSPVARGVVPPGEGHEKKTDVAGGMQMAHEGRNDAHGTGTVNTVDPAQHKLNISRDRVGSRHFGLAITKAKWNCLHYAGESRAVQQPVLRRPHKHNWRALVEADIRCYKRVIGDALRSRTEGRRTTEVAIAVASPNRTLKLGRPEYVRLT
jgi:hypothetical protein